MHLKNLFMVLIAGLLTIMATACEKSGNEEVKDDHGEIPGTPNSPVFLVIDEESIDNGNEPNGFSSNDVNDNLAKIGLRQPLEYFRKNAGKNIVLYTGQVGDEGWHALKTIPNNWKSAGPTNNGARNFLQAGPGLGGGEDNKEDLLDKIPDVTPLRATGLAMLTGKTVLAVVYDSDVSTNYSPLLGSLKGDNLGIVAFDVIKVEARTDGSSSSLPKVTIRIRNAQEVAGGTLQLFKNAPVPKSSSEPEDITPPATIPSISVSPAP